jgi:hypothetical protein
VDKKGTSQQWHSSGANPFGKVFFGSLVVGECEHFFDDIFLGRAQSKAVEAKKCGESDEGDSLVAIDEGMVARQTVCVGGRENDDIPFAVVPLIQRSSQRGLKQVLVTDSRSAEVLLQLVGMEGFEHPMREPEALLTWRVHAERRGIRERLRDMPPWPVRKQDRTR